MKQIRINVPITVICETKDTVIEPIQSFGIHRTDGRFYVRQTIDALCGAARVTIVGDQGAVQSMLADAPPGPHSLIQRALSALGYVVGDHNKDVAQFSKWVDHLVAFPRSEEAKGLWTEAMLRLFGSNSPPLMPSTIAEASGACGAFIVERMRLFPPVAGDSFDDVAADEQDALVASRAEFRDELLEWRSAAKANGIDSPKELAESTTMSFGQFVDRKISREWQEATGCASAFQAQKKLAELEAKLLSYASEIDALRKAPRTHDPVVVNIEHGTHVTPNGQTIGHVHDPERELAKVRAELQSKCREAQTEKERADTAEGMYQAERVKRESEVRSEKERGNVEHKRRVEHDATIGKLRGILHAREDETIIDAAKRAIVPLPKPDKVEPGQRWAFVMTAHSGAEAGNEYLAGRFKTANNHHYGALHEDITTGFYLGK